MGTAGIRLFSIIFTLFILFTISEVKAQDIRGYEITALEILDAKVLFVINGDTLESTTQISNGDTAIVTLLYLMQNYPDLVELTDSLAAMTLQRVSDNGHTTTRALTVGGLLSEGIITLAYNQPTLRLYENDTDIGWEMAVVDGDIIFTQTNTENNGIIQIQDSTETTVISFDTDDGSISSSLLKLSTLYTPTETELKGTTYWQDYSPVSVVKQGETGQHVLVNTTQTPLNQTGQIPVWNNADSMFYANYNVSNDAYDAVIWDGKDTVIPTFNNIRDKIEQLVVVDYCPDSASVITGTIIGGSIDSLCEKDGKNLTIQEASGADPITVNFYFTGVERMNYFLFYGQYNGGATHVLYSEIYNPTTLAWDYLGTFGLDGIAQWHSFPIFNPSEYMSSGNVVVRIRHVSSGIPSHELIIDYVDINFGGGGGGTPVSAGEVSFDPYEYATFTNVQGVIQQVVDTTLKLRTDINTNEINIAANSQAIVDSSASLQADIDGKAPASGSTNYIQNQNASAQTANMWINGEVKANSLQSTVATGTAPLTVASTTLVSNLNADLLDGQHGSYYQPLLTNPITGTLTTGYIPKATGASTLGNSLIYDNGTNVGIGTTNPGSKLEIDVTKAQALSGTDGLWIKNTVLNWDAPTTQNLISMRDYSDVTLGQIKSFKSDGGVWGFSFDGYNSGIASDLMTILGNGNVGIGTTSPSYKLDVSGTGRFTGDVTMSAGASVADAPVLSTDVTRLQDLWDAGIGTSGGLTSGYVPYFTTKLVDSPISVSGADIDVSGKIKLNGTTVAYRPTSLIGTLILGDGGTLLTHTTSEEGYYNTLTGIVAGNSLTTGRRNVANGFQAGYNNTTGSYWTANGFRAGYSNTTGSGWTANGYRAGSSNTTGFYWTANGYEAGFSNTTGSGWTANGFQAGYSNTTGINWTANGSQAARYLADGTTGAQVFNNSVYVGANTKVSAEGVTNENVFGYNATGNGSNSVTLGDDNITKTVLKGNVLVGTTIDNGSKFQNNGTSWLNGEVTMSAGASVADAPVLSTDVTRLTDFGSGGVLDLTNYLTAEVDGDPANELDSFYSVSQGKWLGDGDTITSTADGYVSSLSFSTSTGILTANDPVNGAKTVDLDGRFGQLSGANSWSATNTFQGQLTVGSTGEQTTLVPGSLGLDIYNNNAGDRIRLNYANSRYLWLDGNGVYGSLDAATTTNVVYYNSSTNEFTYGAAPSGTGYWTQASGALYPTTITDELRVGSSTDRGSYIFQSNGSSYFGGNIDFAAVGYKLNWVDATAGAIWIQAIHNSATENTLAIYSAENGSSLLRAFEGGKIQFENYGSGAFTGTAAYNLEVTSLGNIIETTAGSDFRMKKDFRILHNSLDKVLAINTYAFNWIPKEILPKKAPEQAFDIELSQDYEKRESAGVIAQEIEKIIPEAVSQYNNGYYKVDYNVIVPHLIEAIKEQQKQIEELKKQVNENSKRVHRNNRKAAKN